MAVIIVVVMVLLFVANFRIEQASAGAYPGTQTKVATTSQSALTTTAQSLFATSTCTARIISTEGASSIRLTFSDYAGQSPTGTFGHVQLASTTVVYDAEQYGCGLVKAYSYTSQLITITEMKGAQ